MKYNPDVHHRRSIRLKGYNYAQAGAYFVTICTQGRECLFGEIKNGEMELNPAGRMVQAVWEELPEHYSGVEVDEFIVMPNHVHGIIIINEMVGAIHELPVQKHEMPVQKPIQETAESIRKSRRQMVLPKIVGRFKMNSAKRVNEWRETPGLPVWHRNYYEHIIRDEDSLNKIREYIIQNPLRWEFDRENIGGKPDGVEQEFWKDFGQKRR
jgi:REP element-mobilizing transposase RayT